MVVGEAKEKEKTRGGFVALHSWISEALLCSEEDSAIVIIYLHRVIL